MIRGFIFEMKISGGNWVEVSDDTFMTQLYQYHRRLTPYVREMLEGAVLLRGNQSFRISPC